MRQEHEEQKHVIHALCEIGFEPITPFDFWCCNGLTSCGIPVERTVSFKSAIDFCREGAFQSTLEKETRKLYYLVSDLLSQWAEKYEHPKVVFLRYRGKLNHLNKKP